MRLQTEHGIVVYLHIWSNTYIYIFIYMEPTVVYCCEPTYYICEYGTNVVESGSVAGWPTLCS